MNVVSKENRLTRPLESGAVPPGEHPGGEGIGLRGRLLRLGGTLSYDGRADCQNQSTRTENCQLSHDGSRLRA
jgi:hypothetical protein